MDIKVVREERYFKSLGYQEKTQNWSKFGSSRTETFEKFSRLKRKDGKIDFWHCELFSNFKHEFSF